ncbi:hypothetical protein OF83DRAFT_1096383 [Amylostereum chailletii]|nr:hypothetical protein OF83DRAFT_1096383 [Amylostereum chailletii]
MASRRSSTSSKRPSSAGKDRPPSSRRLSWKSVLNVAPKEGVPLNEYPASPPPSSSTVSLPQALSRTSSIESSPSSSRPTTPVPSRRLSISLLTKPQIDPNANLALERTASRTDSRSISDLAPRSSGSFGRKNMSFTAMIPGLSTLSLSRGNASTDKERGRSQSKDGGSQRARSSSAAMGHDDAINTDTTARSRSTSPFRIRRSRVRDPSPAVGAVSHSDVESDSESVRVRPRSSYLSDDESESSSDDDWSDDIDAETEANTELNALVVPAELPEADGETPDLGEGQNIVVPPEPYFPSTQFNHANGRNPRRRKSTRHEPLPFLTSRPVFKRDRCTITITQGDPIHALAESNRSPRSYIVASDMSDESRYAVEWAIGTVVRDGDELLIVHVVENESKVDPPVPNAADRAAKLRSQQERQGMAYILCRQATSLLQRTRLNISISCEAWHAKNARHMLLDIVDYVEPVMLIVGSRGLGQLKGILLGSTSHYLIQKCSVPVMVARRRLKRPPRRAAHLAKHRARVSLAEAAGIERVTPRVDEEVAHMRDEIEREEDRETERMREAERAREGEDGDEGETETEVEGEGHAPRGMGTGTSM